jgi:hypothetical protein
MFFQTIKMGVILPILVTTFFSIQRQDKKIYKNRGHNRGSQHKHFKTIDESLEATLNG